MNSNTKAYLVGGGIGSLSAAAFMIRDGGIPGSSITIFESLSVPGGSLDGGGNPVDGYTLLGGRMLTTDNYECTWDLFKTIPSLNAPGRSVYEETISFNERNIPHSMARLVDRNRFKVNGKSMRFTMQDPTVFTYRKQEGAPCPVRDQRRPAFIHSSIWIKRCRRCTRGNMTGRYCSIQ